MNTTEKNVSDETRYVTVPEAARDLGVGRKIVYQLIDLQRVRVVRKKQIVLIARESLEEFKRSGQLT